MLLDRNKLKTVSTAVGLLLFASSAPTWAADDEAMEEVVVTGSYIKRDNFDTATPLNILTAVEFAEQGVANVGDVIKNQTFNYGSDFITNATASTYQDGWASGNNLRGLGATLTLLDGRRTRGQVNILLPTIAIGRIETLKDGASALYGTDAVAGVVNFIPRRNYEGLEVMFFQSNPQDSKGDYDETQWGIIGGAGNGTTHVMAALEYREHGDLEWADRPDYMARNWSNSSTGNPGSWNVPHRGWTDTNADGIASADEIAITSLLNKKRDPGCGIDNGGTSNKNIEGNNRSGLSTHPWFGNDEPSTCYFEFGEFWQYMTDLEAITGYIDMTHQFADWLTFEVQMSFAKVVSVGHGSPSNPGGRFGDLGAVAGDHPGNPYRAFVDLDGDGVIDDGERLFAQDANGNGVPDRDIDGDGIADIGAEMNTSGTVLLAANPFDPTMGIAFNEDVLIAAWRPFGKQGFMPSSHYNDGSGESSNSGTQRNFRWTTGFDFDIPDTSWGGSFYYTFQALDDSDPENQTESFSALKAGMVNGLLGPNQDRYFNPFSTQEHPCVDRICDPNVFTDPSSPAFNTQFVVDQVSFDDDTDYSYEWNWIDLVLTGDLFELPAGTMAAAVGYQWRRAHYVVDVGPIANACDRWVAACGHDYNEGRTISAVFGEIIVPVFDSGSLGRLELQAAVRYEEYGSEDMDSTDPKIALLYQPVDWLSLRASWGTSFVAPTSGELWAEPISFLQNMGDRTCDISGDCDASEAFRINTYDGNPLLTPEEADTWNIGFTLSLLEGDLTLSMDFLEFDFVERITLLRGPDVIDIDSVKFQAFFNSGGTRATWIDPVNKAAGSGCNGPCETTNIKRASGEIVEVLTSYVNAQEMLWRGLDFTITYHFEGDDIPWIGGDYGSFTTSLTGTYIDTYQYVLTGLADEICGDGSKPPCEGAGNRNDRTGAVPPSPELRMNGKLNWFYGNHNATLIGRYIDSVRNDAFAWDNETFIDTIVTWDAQYSYTFDGLLGGDRATKVTIGGVNIFDNLTDPITTLGGLETFLHDPRGAMWYLRINQDI